MNPVTGEGGRALTGSDVERAGKPLTPRNERFALCELRGDWEWFCLVWRFHASWQALNTCFLCPARSKGDSSLLYHYVEDDSSCIHREFTFHEFVSQRLKDRHLCNLTVDINFSSSCWSLLVLSLDVSPIPPRSYYMVQSPFACYEVRCSTLRAFIKVAWNGAWCMCWILACYLVSTVVGWHSPDLTMFSPNNVPIHPLQRIRLPGQVGLEALRNSQIFFFGLRLCSHRILLCEDLEWFGAGTLQDRLDVAYTRYVQYCKGNKIKQSQPPFTEKMVTSQPFVFNIFLSFLGESSLLLLSSQKKMICIKQIKSNYLGVTDPRNLSGISCNAMAKVKKKDGKEMMTCKAWNGRCVLSWLSNELLQALEIHHENDLLALVCSCANHGFLHCSKGKTMSFTGCFPHHRLNWCIPFIGPTELGGPMRSRT